VYRGNEGEQHDAQQRFSPRSPVVSKKRLISAASCYKTGGWRHKEAQLPSAVAGGQSPPREAVDFLGSLNGSAQKQSHFEIFNAT